LFYRFIPGPCKTSKITVQNLSTRVLGSMWSVIIKMLYLHIKKLLNTGPIIKPQKRIIAIHSSCNLIEIGNQMTKSGLIERNKIQEYTKLIAQDVHSLKGRKITN
jgi:hypothetical protein